MTARAIFDAVTSSTCLLIFAAEDEWTETGTNQGVTSIEKHCKAQDSGMFG